MSSSISRYYQSILFRLICPILFMYVLILISGVSALCQYTCLTCSTFTYCTSCPANRFTFSPGVCACNFYFYDSFGATNCLACHNSCALCTSAASTACTACNPANQRTLIGSSCLCNIRFYQTGTSTCSSCHYSCASCITTAGNCLTCNSVAKRSKVGNACPCIYNYYETGVQTCPACAAYCTGCASNNNFSCDVCLGAYYLTASTSCAACDVSCVTCTNAGNAACITCKSGYTNVTNVCISCDPACFTCMGQPTFCTSCDPARNRAAVLGTCLCAVGFYDVGTTTCSPCDVKCLTCTLSSTYCQSCKTSQHRTIFANTCICQNYYFQAGLNSCQTCLANCYTCTNSASCNICADNYLLNTLQNTCTTNCPPGQFKQFSYDLFCINCHNGCITCNSTACFSCTSAFLLNSTGLYCYQCVCPVCSDLTCGNNCAAGLYSYKTYCFSLCPQTFFKLTSSSCERCQDNCRYCNSTEYCLVCFDGLLSYQGSCFQFCPDSSYPVVADGVCEPCMSASGLYANNDVCNSFKPYCKIIGLANAPHTQKSYEIVVFGKKSIQQSSIKDSFILQFRERGRRVDHCFIYSHCCYNNRSFRIKITNLLNCPVVYIDINVSLLLNKLSTVGRVPFVGFNRSILWPVNVQKYEFSLLQKVSQSFQYLFYLSYLPIVLLIFPYLRIYIFLFFLNFRKTFHFYQVTTLLAATLFKVGTNISPSETYSVFEQKDFNQLSQFSPFSAFIGLFPLDSAIPLIFLGLSLILLVVTLLVKGLWKITSQVFKILNEGMMLPWLAYSLVCICSCNFSGWLSILSFILSLFMLLYWICYCFMILNVCTVYVQQSDSQNRFSMLVEYPNSDLFSALKSNSQDNNFTGVAFPLNPVFYKVGNTVLDSLLIVILVPTSNYPNTHASVFLLFCIIKLARACLKPFANKLLNVLNIVQNSIMLGIAIVSLVSNLLVDNMILIPARRQLQPSNEFYLVWMYLGWVQVGLFISGVLVGGVVSWMSVERVQDLRDSLLSDQKPQMQQQLKVLKFSRILRNQTVIQQEFQNLIIIRQDSNIFIKIKIIRGLTFQTCTSYVHSAIRLVPKSVLRSYMQLVPGNHHFKEFSQYISTYSDNNKLLITSLSTLRFDKLIPGQEIKPQIFYQKMEGNLRCQNLMGPKAISWLPLNKPYI